MRELGSLPLRFALQDTTPDELLSAVLTAVLQDVNLRPEQLGDISVGELTCQARAGSSSSSLPGPSLYNTDLSLLRVRAGPQRDLNETAPNSQSST